MAGSSQTAVRLPWLGAIAAALSIAHAVDLVLRDEAIDMLWLCNLAGPVLALGCLIGRRQLVSIPLLWVSFGSVLWIIETLDGGELLITSIGSHPGMVVVGILAIRKMGWPKHTWWKATAGQVIVLFGTRLVTPAERNINMAFEVWEGWESIFPSYWMYFCVILAASAAGYAATELLLSRLATRGRED